MDLRKVYKQFSKATEAWYVRSSSDSCIKYLVEQLENGSLRCGCVAGQMGRDCKHKKLIRQKFNLPNIK